MNEGKCGQCKFVISGLLYNNAHCNYQKLKNVLMWQEKGHDIGGGEVMVIVTSPSSQQTPRKMLLLCCAEIVLRC